MRYYLVAGEASGDLHGSNLIKAITDKDPLAEFRFWGGDLMEAAAGGRGQLVSHYRQRAFMGLTDVLMNLRSIRKFMHQCRQDILSWKPDALIFIDNPGFNLRIAKAIRGSGIPVHYYIAPKAWAWNKNRVYQLRDYTDHLYCILPFEKAFFGNIGVRCTYVGNPVCDAVYAFRPDPEFRKTITADKPILALLPGSRPGEIRHIMPEMMRCAAEFSDYTVLLAATSALKEEVYTPYLNGNVTVVKDKTYDLLSVAHMALVTSGTATLETALFKVPQVVCFRFGKLSYWVGKMLIKVKFISLVNLIAGYLVVEELIQDRMNSGEMTAQLRRIASGKARSEMLGGYADVAAKLGPAGASERTASAICASLGVR